MRMFSRIMPFAVSLLITSSPLRAQTPADPTGHWEGAIHAPKMEVGIEIDLARNSQGELVGTFSNTDQNTKGLPLANIARDGASITFQIKGSGAGERVFTGTLSPDAAAMSGEYNQSGYTVTFDITRKGEARLEPARANPAVSKSLEGSWQGTLHVNDVERNLILTLTNRPDGTAVGNFVNVEESLEIPIAVITQQADTVTLEVTAVGGSYSGRVDADGTALVGTFRQGPASLPLTFHRKTAGEGKR